MFSSSTKYSTMRLCTGNLYDFTGNLSINKIVENRNEDHGADIKILFLPVAHPQLNYIELIWRRIKTYIASNNFNDENMMARIGELAHEKWASLTAEDWERLYQRSRVFTLGCKDADNSDDTSNSHNDIEPEVSDADKSI
jgi:hypothetical protein